MSSVVWEQCRSSAVTTREAAISHTGLEGPRVTTSEAGAQQMAGAKAVQEEAGAAVQEEAGA
jgi:hypothetical protein